jgi:hypothetical protein
MKGKIPYLFELNNSMKRKNPIPMELRDSMKRKSPYLCVEELNEKKNFHTHYGIEELNEMKKIPYPLWN